MASAADDYVVERSRAIFRELIEEHGVKAMVVACNTATAAAIHLLRREYPELPLVGVEPALKPAVSRSRTGRIGVLATRGTLRAAKFAALARFAQGTGRVRAAALRWAGGGDRGRRRRAGRCALRQVHSAIGEYGTGPRQIDTLVLGCTHYPFAQAQLRLTRAQALR